MLNDLHNQLAFYLLAMDIHIGTSGWSDAQQQGILSPPGTPVHNRLAYYGQRFDTIELNSSFYRWPKLATFTSWRRRLPQGFLLTVKAARGLTHAKKRYALESWIERIQAGWHQLRDKRAILLV